jgi:hypothetical protein
MGAEVSVAGCWHPTRGSSKSNNTPLKVGGTAQNQRFDLEGLPSWYNIKACMQLSPFIASGPAAGFPVFQIQ